MQVAMPCVLFAASPSELHLKGGTNAEMAPQIDYTVMVGKTFFGLVHLLCICTFNVTVVLLLLFLQVCFKLWNQTWVFNTITILAVESNQDFMDFPETAASLFAINC